MKNTEVKEMTDAELSAKLTALQEERFTLRCQSRTGELSNGARISAIRKDIARINTEQVVRSQVAAVE
ncbi:MAG: 50S ribosomal protein L29 [Kiritimatiellaeota bacterium]|nr:50S ribosomal protein L29 [Kiritimatiellota bacterium]